MMAHLHMPSLFADLRGVTVRNTFLEFEDINRDDFLPENGFTRQASEPAKPFHRQVSEQTTAGSGATFEDARGRDLLVEESNTEPEESFPTTLPSWYMGTSLPQMAAAAAVGGRDLGQDPLPQMMLKAALEATASMAPALPTTAQVLHGRPPLAARFCPNCGSEAEPNHRFCPYCCYQLHPFPSALPLGALADDSHVGVAADSPTVSGLLSGIRRFRYVEASQSDVDLARHLCGSLLHSRAI